MPFTLDFDIGNDSFDAILLQNHWPVAFTSKVWEFVAEHNSRDITPIKQVL